MNKTLWSLLFYTSAISLTHAGVFNLVEPDIKWDKKEVSVCFADFSHYKKSYLSEKEPDLNETNVIAYTQSHKEALEDIIIQEYTKERTGIAFIGWKDCQEQPDSDVYLFRISDSGAGFIGVASQGEAGEQTFEEVGIFSKKKVKVYRKQNKDKKAFLALNTALLKSARLSRVSEFQMTALHEFGHLAGLQHEHADIREDNKRYGDSNCSTSGTRTAEGPLSSTKKVSVYDRNSIMNYCYGNILRQNGLNIMVPTSLAKKFSLKDSSLIQATPVVDGIHYEIKIGLSRGDLHGLSCLYLYDNKTNKEICRPEYNPATGSLEK